VPRMGKIVLKCLQFGNAKLKKVERYRRRKQIVQKRKWWWWLLLFL